MSDSDNAVPDTQSTLSTLAMPMAVVIAGALVAGAIIFSNSGSASGTPAAAGGAPTVSALESKEAKQILQIRSTDHVRGDPNAEILVFEYGDLECPFCKIFHENMLAAEKEAGVTFTWVYRHYPLSMHPKAPTEAQAAECVAELGGNNTFWKFIDEIFSVTQGNNTLDLNKLPEYAVAVGVDKGAFSACLSSGKYSTRVRSDMTDGNKIGVQGTPYSVIVNQKTKKMIPIGGAQPTDEIVRLFEESRQK